MNAAQCETRSNTVALPDEFHSKMCSSFTLIADT
jgi:hypothetical protein